MVDSPRLQNRSAALNPAGPLKAELEMIRVVESTSAKGNGAVNEDLFGHAERGAWLLDGATGVAHARIDAVSDAAWLVRRADHYLRAAFDDSSTETAPRLLANVISRLRAELEAATGHDDASFPPSAAFILIRSINNGAEFAALGDCGALFEAPDGKIAYIDGAASPPIDENSLRELQTLQHEAPTASHRDIVKRLEPALRRNRVRMNTPEGYWILSVDETAAEHAHVVNRRIARAPVVLMSDGFSRGMDMLGGLSPEDFYRLVLKQGAATVLERIRDIERADADCRRFPRFKVHDDATCAIVELD